MAAFSPRSRKAPNAHRAALLALAAWVSCAQAARAPATTAGPINLDAASSELDLRTNNVYFRKVRIAQGPMSVTADQGQATREALGGNFDNSLWVFRGNVKITIQGGELTADEAQVDFVNKLLAKAVAHGKPAEFEERIEKTGKIAHGHADNIDYDASKGVVRLTDNAWLSDGQNEVRGQSLKYNVLAQSIIADAAEQNSQRVHIIITPPPQKP
ncbi:MAG TPA: lipopolysaccharide transport periplasmic protein LptA [Steroidobacteraceae bacterium]|nr:lipopolysaccharide transport periplasmic protein LptA [Steroidobacteraceae bacterium]